MTQETAHMPLDERGLARSARRVREEDVNDHASSMA
jgi:hypothetical protein